MGIAKVVNCELISRKGDTNHYFNFAFKFSFSIYKTPCKFAHSVKLLFIIRLQNSFIFDNNLNKCIVNSLFVSNMNILTIS